MERLIPSALPSFGDIAPPLITTILRPEGFIVEPWLERIVSQKFATRSEYHVISGVSLLGSLYSYPRRATLGQLQEIIESSTATGNTPRIKAVRWAMSLSKRAANLAKEQACQECLALESELREVENLVINHHETAVLRSLDWLCRRDDVRSVSDLFVWAKQEASVLDNAIHSLDMSCYVEKHRLRHLATYASSEERLIAVGIRLPGNSWWGDMAYIAGQVNSSGIS